MRHALLMMTLFTTGCATLILPGEVGVRRSFGKLADSHRGPGMVVHSPVGMRFVKVPVRTQNLEIELDLPSQEGLNVQAAVSILFSVVPDKAPMLIEEVGTDFQASVVAPVFRSAAADVSARFLAKDMHSGERSAIESDIADRMNEVLAPRGIRVEAVLMKSIKLPDGLYGAIEDKLAAEQSAERMRFVLQQEEQEAERRRVEAQGIRDAQRILEEGLSPQILSWRSIEAFQELAQSENAKVIITDGEAPFLLPIPEDSPSGE